MSELTEDQALEALADALRNIRDSHWSDGESYEARIADLQAQARAALLKAAPFLPQKP